MCSFLLIFRACQTVQGQKQRSVHRTFFAVVNRLKNEKLEKWPWAAKFHNSLLCCCCGDRLFSLLCSSNRRAGDKGHSRCRKVRRLNSLGYISRRASLWNKSIAALNFAHRKYRLFAKIKISLQLSISALGRLSPKCNLFATVHTLGVLAFAQNRLFGFMKCNIIFIRLC